MKLNRKVQIGFLFAIYLANNGQSKLEVVSNHYGLSLHFLEQIARKLRIAGVVKSVRGPGGGYQLVPGTTNFDVLKALGANEIVAPTALTALSQGSLEESLFAGFINTWTYSNQIWLQTPIAVARQEGQVVSLNNGNLTA